MLKKIIIILLIIVAGFAVVTALQPSEFRISRQLTIAAPAADIFAQVNDFKIGVLGHHGKILIQLRKFLTKAQLKA